VYRDPDCAALERLGGVGPPDLDIYRHQITCIGTKS
jgi:hypothetical protein